MKYKLQLQPSEIVYDISTEVSILDASMEKNIYLEHGCRKGDCGNCKAKLISGTVNTALGELIDSGDILTCLSFAKSDLILEANYIPELANIKPITLPCKVSNIKFVNQRFAIVTLRIPSQSGLKFLPGQYIDLSYQQITRSYSIASLVSSDNTFDLHIRLFDNGQFSQLLQSIELNQVMRFTGPKGSFFIRKTKQPILLLASGTGFAPIHAMVQALIAENDKRDIYIYWRMRQANYFYIENPFLMQDAENIKFIPFVTEKDAQWHGRTGHINDILSLDFESLSGFSKNACGSVGLKKKKKKVCLQLQLNENDFYTDLFTPA